MVQIHPGPPSQQQPVGQSDPRAVADFRFPTARPAGRTTCTSAPHARPHHAQPPLIRRNQHVARTRTGFPCETPPAGTPTKQPIAPCDRTSGNCTVVGLHRSALFQWLWLLSACCSSSPRCPLVPLSGQPQRLQQPPLSSWANRARRAEKDSTLQAAAPCAQSAQLAASGCGLIRSEIDPTQRLPAPGRQSPTTRAPTTQLPHQRPSHRCTQIDR